jgi:hypothetical protein
MDYNWEGNITQIKIWSYDERSDLFSSSLKSIIERSKAIANICDSNLISLEVLNLGVAIFRGIDSEELEIWGKLSNVIR